MIVKRFFIVFALGLIALLGMLIVNTISAGQTQPPDMPPVTKASIDADGAALRLGAAVRIKTISRNHDGADSGEDFLKLHAFLERQFPRVHRTLRRETVNRFSLLYTWQGSDPSLKPILISAHMDVVPVEPGTEKDWTHPPFGGAVKGGYIWGRGTMDMKGTLMGVLEAVEYLLSRDFAPKRTIYLAFGHDEEIGGEGGAARIAAKLAARGQRLSFVLDEGMVVAHGIVPGVTQPVALIGLAQKGYVTLEFIARSPGGHSSRPPRTSAIGKLSRALHRLEANPMPRKMTKPVAGMLDALAPHMPLIQRMVVANRWLLEPILLSRLEKSLATNAAIRTTTAITQIEGGIKPNVLPQKARALVNFRILPGDDVASLIRHVKTAIADPEIEVRRDGHRAFEPSPVSDPNSAGFFVLRTAVRQVFPDVLVAPSLVLGATDSRYYEDISDNSFRLVPMRLKRTDLKRIHGTDERIAVANYAEMIRFYIQLFRNGGR